MPKKLQELFYCVRFSAFLFPLLWHFHCSNQRPFPLSLSTMEIENSCSPILWTTGSLCALCCQGFKVTFNTWRGQRGKEFGRWEGFGNHKIQFPPRQGSFCNFHAWAFLGLHTNTSRTGDIRFPRQHIYFTPFELLEKPFLYLAELLLWFLHKHILLPGVKQNAPPWDHHQPVTELSCFC